MEVLVLGGDGFCGWPTSLHLADQGYNVTIVDNLSRRRIDDELGVQSLTPIRPIDERLAAWEEVAGSDKKIGFEEINIADINEGAERLTEIIDELRPDAVIHFAEQRSAPYSEDSPKRRRYTVNNNVNATNNVLTALIETGTDTHFIHLGTTGRYGYDPTEPGEAPMPMPEGFMKVQRATPTGKLVEIEVPYPPRPGSAYHNTKIMDYSMMELDARIRGVRSTNLEQGIVWGTQTEQTILHPDLINRYDYDEFYGTVLNRFLAQAAIGHPLTIYGKIGGQTRAFINIQDTVRCVELALDNPPERRGRVAVFNQAAETRSVRELAQLVCKLYPGTEIQHVENPRVEADENELIIDNHNFLDLKWDPIMLSGERLIAEAKIAQEYAHRIDESKIMPTAVWRVLKSKQAATA